ncbi:hypothetical protein [Flavihumibacter profundi]|uniref:hypothetical protein n=1 Tax=Flavihumibacter profundi TaxID=2716883 RepID=UPI001CC81E57|nr:hypothetical protein [Flavihumibacter profundi]MBZ5857731.1 hypothetical protein [Flavihumibacter profundi]
MTYKLSIFTQYGQFYIADKYASGDTGSQDFWNSEAFNDRLAIDDGILGVSIENDEAQANIEIELLDSKIDEKDLSKFDHIVEGSLLIKSGKLQILDCPNFKVELELNIEPDWYKVRVSSSNLDKAYQENPGDKYFIKIWKENYSKRNVIKRRHRI